MHVTLSGPELADFDPGLPGASVRLLLPTAIDKPPEIPVWNGNEFLDADGSRPTIRTLTPVSFDAAAAALEVQVVLHGDGPLSEWAEAARPGSPVAVSGTGRGYEIEPTAHFFVLAGDESAVPAIRTLIPALPTSASAEVIVEVADPSDPPELPHRPGVSVRFVRVGHDTPGNSLVDAVTHTHIDAATRVWVAGEAAAVQRIRSHLFDTRGVPRAHAVVRGYWKHGRVGGA